MASANVCDTCFKANMSMNGAQYCSNCEERLCSDCAETHTLVKAFKSHQLIDQLSVDFNVQISDIEICNVHLGMLLDCYCPDHDIVCCRICISNEHKVCQNILPLELASNDVKDSALFTDCIQIRKHLFASLNDFTDNRRSCLQSLKKSKTAISKQIGAVKLKLLKQIDDWECKLNDRVSSHYHKQEMKINKQKEEISQVFDTLKANEKEIDYLQRHGSNDQLFISLRRQVTNFQIVEANIQQMVLSSEEITLTFPENDSKIDFFGSLLEASTSCHFQYKPWKFQQAQVITEPTKRMVGFQNDMELKLARGRLKKGTYNFSDISVTEDDKVLVTNDSSLNPILFVLSDFTYESTIRFSSEPRCVAVIPGTDKAVVTLPEIDRVQFINTSKMTSGDKVNVRFRCIGIAAGSENIYVGGKGGIIKILNTDGIVLTTLESVNLKSDIHFLLYDNFNEQIIARIEDKLLCLKLDGTEVYSRLASGIAGVTLDRHRNIYFGDFYASTVQRMSSNGQNCEEMLNKSDEISFPSGMCFNTDCTKLCVINNVSTVVCVYKTIV